MAGITVTIIEPGARGEELLTAVVDSLQVRPNLTVDGAAHFWFSGMAAQEAWEATIDALNAAGDDWPDHLHPSSLPELEPAADRVCSFCGKPERIVEKLVAGPGIYICDECVALCVEIIESERSEPAPPASNSE